MSVTNVTLVRYLEIWQVGDDGALAGKAALTFSADGPRDVGCDSLIAQAGEGIAGSAWKQNAPVVIQDEGCVMLKEASERSGEKLNALVAAPFVNDRNSVTIVVFGLGEGFGGLEVWSPDDRDELSISGSYYQGMDSFEFISQYIRFPRGSGLPGQSWKLRRPTMIKDPGVDADFIRSFANDPADMSACVGIPVTCDYGSDGAVLLLLSSTQQPIVRQIDILSCESSTPTEDDAFPPVRLVQHETTTAESNGEVGESTSRLQVTCDRLAQKRDVIWLSAGEAGVPANAQASLVVPFFDKGRISTALQLSF